TPKNNDWSRAFREGWELDPSSIIGNITHKGLMANRSYFSTDFESEVGGTVDSVQAQAGGGFVVHIRSVDQMTKHYTFDSDAVAAVSNGDQIKVGSAIAHGSFTNRVFYIDMARLGLIGLFGFIAWQVYRATKRRERLGFTGDSETEDDDLSSPTI
ncbi:MAG: hypothetical protein KGQ80_04875, partial [Bacteroidetes bacterium]|nr:hypothetical protein [Bacteroidota bacterium]